MSARIEIGSLVVALVLAQGCGVIPGKGTDGGPGDGGPGACNDLVNGAAVTSKTSHAAATPAMTGGTIADGTYFLTAMDDYNGETGSTTHQETWRFTNGTVDVITAENGAAATRYSGTFSTSGNMVTFSFTCPMTGSVTSPLTATSNELQTVNSNDANEVHTFTRQ